MPPTPQASGLHRRTAAHERHALAPARYSPTQLSANVQQRNTSQYGSRRLAQHRTPIRWARRPPGPPGTPFAPHTKSATVGPTKASGIEERKKGADRCDRQKRVTAPTRNLRPRLLVLGAHFLSERICTQTNAQTNKQTNKQIAHRRWLQRRPFSQPTSSAASPNQIAPLSGAKR